MLVTKRCINMMRTVKENEKKDYFTVVMAVQSVVGVILIVAMLLSLRGDGKVATIMREGYIEYMSDEFTAEEFSEALNGISDFSSVVAAGINSDVAAVMSENNTDEIPAKGGVDLEFSSLETLEGISFDDVDAGFSMIYPLDDYILTSDFGYRVGPISGEPGIHTGIDMAADYGTDISAAADGTVTDARWDSSYGNYVRILHKNNTVSIYAHCSVLCVDEGEYVRSGDKIAEVGSTGASTGNHLHFEVRKDNIRINPFNLLDEA